VGGELKMGVDVWERMEKNSHREIFGEAEALVFVHFKMFKKPFC
jgi:hypothetical protein